MNVRKKGCDKNRVTALLLRKNGVQKLASAVISPAKLKTLGAVFTWLFLLLDAEQLFYNLLVNGVPEVASTEISRNFLKLTTSVTTSFFTEVSWCIFLESF